MAEIYKPPLFKLCYNCVVKNLLYVIIQCAWGMPQTLLGLALFLVNARRGHFLYHGAVVTEWKSKASVSLGMFVFVAESPMKYKRTEGRIPDEELARRLLVHEYGHTVQSLALGPLYLIAVGIPFSAFLRKSPPIF